LQIFTKEVEREKLTIGDVVNVVTNINFNREGEDVMGKLLMKKFSSSLLALIAIFALATLVGCEGDDGARGPAGQTGPAGPVTTTDESCNVCHAQDRGADIANFHPAPLVKPVVSDIVVSRAGDVLTVTFSVLDPVNPLPGIDPAEGNLRVYMADLVPAGTPTANLPQGTWGDPVDWPTGFFELWAEETSDDAGVVATDNGDGTYSFTMATTLADVFDANGDPITDANGDPIGNAPDGNLDDIQRVYVRADARDLPGFTRTMGVADFTMPADGADTGVIDTTTRTIVDASACTTCHNDPLQRAAHGGGYQSPQVCNMCHSPIGAFPENVGTNAAPVYEPLGDVMQETGFWLASLIHKIHSAGVLPGADFSEVTYPKNIKDCQTCHFDVGQDMAENWRENPTKEVCTTCHDVTFGVGATHTGGAQLDNSGCFACHGPLKITAYHAVDTLKNNPDISIIPKYFTKIALSVEDANGDFVPAPAVFNTGDVIMVTVTVEDVNGDPISTYNDAASTFTAANLYVYGPRSNTLPVLTTGSAMTPIDQSQDMRVPSSDPQVRTDAEGFKYELMPIPAGLASGTYMVQAYVTDPSSRVIPGDHPYSIDGWALTTMQVKTATVEKKVAGECTACHDQNDWGTMYHRSYFGTDGCIACHDKSGGHADPIANRVHAVHAASKTGDYLGYDWSEITFPQDISSCEACHNSGSDQYISTPTIWAKACMGCHADVDGAWDHALQNGAPEPAAE
jgi:hypothetical protein